MSIMNPLPPQAYTKETLVQAYAWLQSQSESIKEMATTPDVLVSLFLKARLQGNGALERPSIQNFKNELKSLAGMMGEFEVPEPLSPQPQPQAQLQPNPPPNPTFRFRSSEFKERLTEKQSQIPPQAPHRPVQLQFQSQPQSEPAQPLPPQSDLRQKLSEFQESPSVPTDAPQGIVFDNRSLDMIQEVKIQFNLSSDTEAMRLLLAIGYNQVRNLLK